MEAPDLTPPASDDPKARQREALRAALRAGALRGVATATEHFDRHPVATPRHADAPALVDVARGLTIESDGPQRVLVQRHELPLDGLAPADLVPALPIRWAEALDRAAAWSMLFPSLDDHEGPLDPTRIAFLDTETTGLAGGTGTVAFLIGVGRFVRAEAGGPLSAFVVELFLIEDYEHEPLQLALVAARLRDADAVCTYNGAGFDMPLLRTRAVMQRQALRVFNLPNIDLLPMARRLWRGTLPSCSLTTVEREVLGLHRPRDIEGARIPGLWQEFARSRGAAGEMPLVLFHNAQDIVSLGALLARMAATITSPGEAVTRGSEAEGLARFFDKRRDRPRAAALLERALDLGLDRDREHAALLQLAKLYKRLGELQKAVDLWESLCRRPLAISLPAWIELARHHEHDRRDITTARRLVSRCLGDLDLELQVRQMRGLPPPDYPKTMIEDLRRRADRLAKHARP